MPACAAAAEKILMRPVASLPINLLTLINLRSLNAVQQGQSVIRSHKTINTMKRVLTSALAILLVTSAVQAQTETKKDPQHQQHHGQKDGVYKQLDLSSDQQAKLKTLRESFRQQQAALKAQNLSDAERKTQMKTLHQQHKTQMEALLTAAQK